MTTHRPRVLRASRRTVLWPVLGLGLAAYACGGRITEVEPPGGDPQGGDPPVGALVLTVDVTKDAQTFDGFGSFTHPLVYGGTDYLGSLRARAVEAVYGDVGMRLGLLNIGIAETTAGTNDPWGSRKNDDGDPFTRNPGGFDFTGLDVIHQKVVQPASQYGYVDVTLAYLLQPATTQSWLMGIRSQDYARYLDEAAENVLTVVEEWRDRFGALPRYLHLFNEPTSGNRDLASTSISEVVDLVRTVGDRLSGAGIQPRFIVPNEETAARTAQVAGALLSNADTRPYVAVIAYHPYPYGSAYASVSSILSRSGAGSPDAGEVAAMQTLRGLGLQYGVPVWLTETSEGPGNNSYGFGAIETVLARAIHIHDNFEYAGASAYFGMNTMWDSRSHEEHFSGRGIPFLSEQSGVVLVDLDGGNVMITGMGYAIGHYARWVKPGDIRVEADSPASRVFVTAFRTPGRSRLTVVVVNNTDKAESLRVQVQGATPTGTVTGEVSLNSSRWAGVTSATISGDEVRYQAPARSVVTLSVALN